MSVPIVHQAPSNPRAASENRRVFDALGVVCLNLLGSTGCGKTALLEAILPRIKDKLRVGVLEGDLAASCDAERIGDLGVPVVQVLTDGRCHLAAHQVRQALAELPLHDLDLLIIEGVGSPACQAAADLGEHARAAALSISSGPMVPAKFPMLFRDAAVILVTKYDLLPHVDFDLSAAVATLKRLNPAAEIICTDTKHRRGIDRLAGWLLGYVRAQRRQALPAIRVPQPAGVC
jgi:hydrogenase nickel incorporation protein HypB